MHKKLFCQYIGKLTKYFANIGKNWQKNAKKLPKLAKFLFHFVFIFISNCFVNLANIGKFKLAIFDNLRKRGIKKEEVNIIYKKFKNNNIFKDFLINDKNIFTFNYRFCGNNQEEIIIEDQYVIVDKKIIKNIISENISDTDIISFEYYIKNQKINLKYEQKKNIIIGSINIINNYCLLVPEYIIDFNKYDNNDLLDKQFNFFKDKGNDIIEKFNLKEKNGEEIKITINCEEISVKTFYLKKSKRIILIWIL